MGSSLGLDARIALLIAAGSLAGCIPQGTRPPSYGSGPSGSADNRPAPTPVSTLPAPPPAWESRPAVARATAVTGSIYTVKRGDTLRGIGNRTGAGSEAIAHANNLAPPYTIYPGQKLNIPAGRYHLVREGETGIAIAYAYGVDWSRVVTANNLEEPYILRVGQRLLIPETGPLTLEQRAARFTIDIDDIVTGGEPALASNKRPTPGTAATGRVLPASAAVAEPARLTSNFAWPVHGKIVGRFGQVGSGERNDGIKIAVPLDTPILAAADGVVAYVGGDIPALGGLVILKHGDGWTTVYGHAGQLLVQRGQSVKKGQMIGLSGNSGAATQPSLHFELRQGRSPIDPLTRLPKE